MIICLVNDDNELGFAVLDELVKILAAPFAAALATIVFQSFQVWNVIEILILVESVGSDQFTCSVFY